MLSFSGEDEGREGEERGMMLLLFRVGRGVLLLLLSSGFLLRRRREP